MQIVLIAGSGNQTSGARQIGVEFEAYHKYYRGSDQ
jgi:hypothetical protein